MHHEDNQGFCHGCRRPIWGDAWLAEHGFYGAAYDDAKAHQLFTEQVENWQVETGGEKDWLVTGLCRAVTINALRFFGEAECKIDLVDYCDDGSAYLGLVQILPKGTFTVTDGCVYKVAK